MEKFRKNLTLDQTTAKLIDGKTSEEICYLIRLGFEHSQNLTINDSQVYIISLLENLCDISSAALIEVNDSIKEK